MILATENLVKQYPGRPRPALCGLDLQVPGPGVIGILGPNGAGKTTLVEILEGLRAPTSGRVEVLGLDPIRDGKALRERIGVQLQTTSLPGDLRVAEVVDLQRSFYRTPRPGREVLEEVSLAGLAGALVRTLSGGERQRLALALALVHDPELLLLDEPTAALDPVARRAVHDVVRRLRAQGRTLLLTTHSLEEAEALCDRLIVVQSGRVVADGTPLELQARAAGPSTLWLALEGEPDLSRLAAAGLRPEGREGPHLRFQVPQPAAALLALSELLRSPEVRVRDFRLRQPSLEDFYLQLVGPGAAA